MLASVVASLGLGGLSPPPPLNLKLSLPNKTEINKKISTTDYNFIAGPCLIDSFVIEYKIKT